MVVAVAVAVVVVVVVVAAVQLQLLQATLMISSSQCDNNNEIKNPILFYNFPAMESQLDRMKGRTDEPTSRRTDERIQGPTKVRPNHA